MLVTKGHPQLSFLYGIGNLGYFAFYPLRLWGWLHFIIFESRKHMKKNAIVAVNPFTGYAANHAAGAVRRGSALFLKRQ